MPTDALHNVISAVGRVENSRDFVERPIWFSFPTNFAERQKHDSNRALKLSRATETNGQLPTRHHYASAGLTDAGSRTGDPGYFFPFSLLMSVSPLTTVQ